MYFIDKPCAAHPLKSYRFDTKHGYVMIGATDDADAMREARRSTDKPGVLMRWDREKYVAVKPRHHNYMLRFMGCNLTYWSVCTSRFATWNENPRRIEG